MTSVDHRVAPGRPVSTLRRRIRVGLGGALGTLALVVAGFLIWAHTPATAERDGVIAVWANDAVQVDYRPEGILMSPAGSDASTSTTGVVFVPGARVQAHAYMLTLSGLVETHGVTVLITTPTLNLAFFDTRNLADLTSAAPHVTRWYLAGHSLGGVRACLMAPDSEAVGLALMGSYCAGDISDTDLSVLSIAAENDGLSTPDTIERNAGLLPPTAQFVTIPGANHASFGDYGPQAGDGPRTITVEAMRDELSALLGGFLR